MQRRKALLCFPTVGVPGCSNLGYIAIKPFGKPYDYEKVQSDCYGGILYTMQTWAVSDNCTSSCPAQWLAVTLHQSSSLRKAKQLVTDL
jgi:hypothetical protein